MSRVLRPQLPGVAFHITARTQGKQPWFDEGLRNAVERHIREGVASSDARLLAYIVMPNHFHIVLRQGMRPLGWIMQPIMRRIALSVQRRHQLQGHVFERRFRSIACNDAEYLRNAIVYTHLNAQRAGLSPAYRWSSAVLYERGVSRDVCDVAVTFALRLFADAPTDSDIMLRAAYARYLAWRMARDNAIATGKIHLVAKPRFAAGDAHFAQSFCSLPDAPCVPRRDLRDEAIKILHGISLDVDIDDLRGRGLTHHQSELRRELIAALLQKRYAGRKIANFFCVSDSTVSRIATQMRYAPLETAGHGTTHPARIANQQGRAVPSRGQSTSVP